MVAVGACGGSDDSEGQAPSAVGAAGQAGAAGQGSTPLKGALFEVPDDLSTLAEGCSIDGIVVDGECMPRFLDHPYPSDWRRDADGRVRTKGYPNFKGVKTVQDYIDFSDRLLEGFSPQAAGFVRFAVTLDPATLPKSPTDSLDAAASVQLVDVDDASPEKGKRRLIDLYYREKVGAYWQPSTLAYLPVFGYPLRPNTRYAFVVTDAAKAVGGAALTRPPALDAVLGLGPDVGGTAKVRAAWAPAIANLSSAGVDKARVQHLAVFTTGDPSAELYRVRDHVRSAYPAPALKGPLAQKDDATSYDVYEGNYGPSPDFQRGTIPFEHRGDGGSFAFGADGKPEVQREFDLRFALSVPKASKCPMPAAGYPIVLYAHGTTGSYRSFINDGTARSLAELCVASMGVDQIFHGTRPGAPTGPDKDSQIQLLFFNFENPEAARTNGRQSAIDEVQRARLFTETKMVIPAAESKTGAEIRFDGSKLMFYGHSQGGLNGPLYLAADDSARGGVLSGSGSVISITLLEKTKPLPSVAAVVKGVFLGLKPAEFEELNSFHPVISMAQQIVDSLDPIHYVGHIIRSPRPGFAPKSVYQTEGVNADFTGDSYTPPHAIEVQAVATGLPLMNPTVHSIREMTFGDGFGPISIPSGGLSGNLAGGKATGVLAQWPAAKASDGHFVIFDIDAAQLQAAQFCRDLAADPVGRVTPPGAP